MRSTLTSFARKFFAIDSLLLTAALSLVSSVPAMAQLQPQQPATVPGPFQGLSNVLHNSYAPQPRPPVNSSANPPTQPAPPPTIVPSTTLENGAR
jgi:hypothetical protein